LRTQHSRRKRAAPARTANADAPTADTRRRILEAAFAAFLKNGYSDTSTLEIATRAKVSKRELYALVGSKQDMLVACIDARATRMRPLPDDAPKPHDRASLGQVLEVFGTRLLTEATHPVVIAVHRLAIAEVNRTPEVARVLQTVARDPNRAVLRQILSEAQSAGVIVGDPLELTERFMGLLWGDLLVNLLMRNVEAPEPAQIRRRAEYAASALLKLSEK
jgi:AcrR family transcriptional regulator